MLTDPCLAYWKLKVYRNTKIQQELSLTPEVDIVLRGNRLVVPRSLRKRVVQLAHAGHQGLIKRKTLLREKVWFPGIDTLAAKTVTGSLACQSVAQPPKPSPLPIPLQAWDTVYVDFLGPWPLPSKDLLLVVIDGRTRSFLKLKLYAEQMQDQRSIVLLVSLRRTGCPEHLFQTMGYISQRRTASIHDNK